MANKILLIGTLPPPYDGQSVAFKAFVDNVEEKKKIQFKTINISAKSRLSNVNLYTLFRAVEYLNVVLKLSFWLILGYRTVYLQIAQSKRGFLRDRIIIGISYFFKCKLILHLHGGNYNGFYDTLGTTTQKLVRETLKKADKIIVLSNCLISMFDFEPSLRKKIVSVANGVGVRNDRVQGKKLDQENGVINILYLSNLVETKGYLYVLESIKILVDTYNLNVKASFCGRFIVDNDQTRFQTVEEAQEHFFDKVDKYGLTNVVKYEGVVTKDIKQNIIDKAHFFVLPTQYVNEGQPISIIEAMRTGSVVITTNYRAMPEMIENGENGFLLNEISPDAVASIIFNLSLNKPLYERISYNAIRCYNEKFTEEKHCNSLYSILASNNNSTIHY